MKIATSPNTSHPASLNASTTSNEDVLCGYNSKSFDATGIKRMGKKYKS
mgnify:CR=1 FL=1